MVHIHKQTNTLHVCMGKLQMAITFTVSNRFQFSLRQTLSTWRQLSDGAIGGPYGARFGGQKCEKRKKNRIFEAPSSEQLKSF